MGIRATEQETSVVRACEASRALEVELAGLRERRAEIRDAEVATYAVAVDQTGAEGLWSTAIAEVAFEAGGAIAVRATFSDGRDVTAAVGTLTIASDGAIPIAQADPEIVRDAGIALRIAIGVTWTVEVALAGDLNLAFHRARAIDWTAAEKKDQGQ
jgi:hypothetical protein